jgi:hypothetical protein
MEQITQEIIEITGFKITASTLFRKGQEHTHYNIRNKDGEIVSRNYQSIDEPMQLLWQIE